ncbi:hypothetical protein GOODEAATRI_033121 [Goodea atripinnis]|uniref:VIT domain-containing protein n=1 Tax=Goodea atripinnis TaxID=208336 RepID=A0ABV0PTP5_9TELE
MRRAVVQLPLFGLLMAVAAAIPNKDDWDIYSFHINSTVTGRYATTIITSRVANRMDESREIEFHVQIPKNAFISRFTMCAKYLLTLGTRLIIILYSFRYDGNENFT